MFMRLALKSLIDRKGSVLLTLLAMTVSLFVLLGVEHIRHQAKDSFANTLSGVDLMVGARTSSLNLLLYSVFKIGTPTNNIGWRSYQKIASWPQVKWAVPISLGDSHKGFRVMGTSKAYFEHYSYGKRHALTFEKGAIFNDVFDVVLGSTVAKQLHYQLGDKLVLAHGLVDTHFNLHDDKPFQVVGILAPTGTPVDQTLHVSLQGIEAIHADWQQGVHVPGSGRLHDGDFSKLQPKSITAFMLGLKSKLVTFKIQRDINQYKGEPLLAILPGVALSDLWRMMGVLENTLLLVSILVFIAACLGVSAMLLASVRERAGEIQLLRVAGASPGFVFLLIQLEALLITLCSVVLGVGLLTLCIELMQDSLSSQYGLHVESNVFSTHNIYVIVAFVATSVVAAVIPSLSGYTKAKFS